MATKTTGWYALATAELVSAKETPTTATVKVTSYWKNDGWTYDINNVDSVVYAGSQSYKVASGKSVDTTSSSSAQASLGSYEFVINKTTSAQSISCYSTITSKSSYVSGTKTSSTVKVTVPAITSYTVAYNANGGIGAPSNQTKLYGTALSLSATKPTREGYAFQGWATSATGTVAYAAGASYTNNANVTLYAVWKANTYTITYNANGGSGAPASQTKTYGTPLTLTGSKPSRTNYNFLGWATSAGATSAVYSSGDSYTDNANVTLYAVWELAYTAPRITNFTAVRCDSTGAASNEGTYIKVNASWATDKNVSVVRVQWKTSTGNDWTSVEVSANGTSGVVDPPALGAGNINTELSYTVQLIVMDTDGGTTASTTVASMVFSFDALAGGKGVAFGKPAQNRDTVDSIWSINTDATLSSKGGSIELNKGGSLSGFGGFIDFHYDGSNDDYTSRIIEDGLGKVSVTASTGLFNNGNRVALSSTVASSNDPDTTTEPLILTNTNTPMGTGYYMYIHTYFSGNPSTNGERSQIALPCNRIGSMYHRYYSGGAWSTWRRHVNADEMGAYITASGTSGIWNYTKWSDGTAECWGNTTTSSVNITQAFGSVYRSTTTFKQSFPFTFADIPYCDVSIGSAGDWALWEIARYRASTTTTKEIYVGRASSNSGVSVTFSWYAKGKLA